jgi:hypothetical protein
MTGKSVVPFRRKCSQGADTPLPVSSRTVETTGLPAKRPSMRPNGRSRSRNEEITVNIARAAQHAWLRLIILGPGRLTTGG